METSLYRNPALRRLCDPETSPCASGPPCIDWGCKAKSSKRGRKTNHRCAKLRPSLILQVIMLASLWRHQRQGNQKQVQGNSVAYYCNRHARHSTDFHPCWASLAVYRFWTTSITLQPWVTRKNSWSVTEARWVHLLSSEDWSLRWLVPSIRNPHRFGHYQTRKASNHRI